MWPNRSRRQAARRWPTTPTRPTRPAEAIVAAALERWGRLDICVANAAIGAGGMFHKQPAAQFGEVLEINLHGSIRLARAAMAVMRPAGYGRLILVGSTGGLHGDVGLSAYAASKGGRGEPREYRVSVDAFNDLMSGGPS